MVKVVYDGPSRQNLPKGAPLIGARVVFTATSASNGVLLADATQNSSPPADKTEAWVPKTITVKTNQDGHAAAYFKAPHKRYTNLSHVINAVVLGQASKTSVNFRSNITALPGDMDGDGLPDAWEIANKLDAKDPFNAHPSPLNFGYHRDTPRSALAADLLAALDGLWETASDTQILRDYALRFSLPQQPSKYTLQHKSLVALLKTDPDHDGISNLREFQLNLNPRMPDNPLTLNRDSDGDGFTNEEERLAGTQHLNRLLHPEYEITIMQGEETQEAYTNDVLATNLIVKTTYNNMPRAGIPLVFKTSILGTQLADNRLITDWTKNTLEARTGPDGLCEIRVKAPTEPGTLTITCQSLGIESLKVEFHADIEFDEDNPNQDYTISIVQGNSQTTYLGRRLRNPLSVIVRYGNQPVGNMPISFVTESNSILVDRLGQRSQQELNTVTQSTGIAFIRLIPPNQIMTGSVIARLSPTKSVRFDFKVVTPPPDSGQIYRPGDNVPGPDPTKTNAPHELVWQNPFIEAYSAGSTSKKASQSHAFIDASSLPPSSSTPILDGSGSPRPGENEVFYRSGTNIIRQFFEPGYGFVKTFETGEEIWQEKFSEGAPQPAESFSTESTIPDWKTHESVWGDDLFLRSSFSKRVRELTEPATEKEKEKKYTETTIVYEERKQALRLIARAPGQAENRNSTGVFLEAGIKKTFIPKVTITQFNDLDNPNDNVVSVEFLPSFDITIPPGFSSSVEYFPGDIPGYDQYFPAAENSSVTLTLLPIEFEVKHTEIDPATGQVVNPGANTMLRDEIVDIKIKVPPIGTTDWTVDLTVEPQAMRNENLPNRGNVQMYDFGQVETDGTVTPDKTQFVLQASTGGERTIKAVFNKEGTLKIKMKSTDGKIDFTSPDYTIQKRMRKYASLPSSQNHDLNQHDKAFEDAATHWGGVYQHQVDDVERLKAMGMAESELGLTDATDILTVGNNDDFVIPRLKGLTSGVRLNGTTATWTKEFEFLPSGEGYSPSYYNYQDASKATAPVAIKWGVCWFYKKGMISGLDSNNQPTYAKFDGWRTWDATTTRYNGGGVDNYLERVNRAMKEGRHPSNANLYIWPLKSNKKARGNQ